ncbi:MAG: site-specific DNA-methyltransferase, partial [Ruminococcus sp.]|nr:site-specific DNA-methyltransferase [Ruminococcus sp.]
YILCYEKKRNSFKYRGVTKTSAGNNGLLNQTNKFSQLVFPAGVVDTKLKDGVYTAGEYGTNNYRIVLHDDVIVKNKVITNEFRMSAKFKWRQENLIKEIQKGTKISIKTKAFSPSYDKVKYDAEVPPNFIDIHVGVNTTEEAGKRLNELFCGINIFDYPKDVNLIKYLISFIDTENEIILDFFSGSATTAHAVMQLNAEDGGNRKYIMVQLPEPCNKKSEAYREGYNNICEIGKERIRRAGVKIREENSVTTENFDTGFRVLKIDTTNMNDVYYSPFEITQDMLIEQVENIKPDRTDLDLLFSCLLEWGIPLNMPYISEKIDGCTVHTYNDGDLIACFNKDIPESVVKIIAERQPLRVVFRDSCFADSSSKINVGEIFKMLAPDTRVKVI